MQKSIYTICLVSLAWTLVSCGGNTDESETTADPVNIINPYTKDGVDSSIIEDMGRLVFADTVHDFGNISEGEVVEWDVEYTNEGSGPVVIQSATASCGCTVPEYSREPLAPGESGSMTIKFDSQEKHGRVEKEVNIQTNGFPAEYKLKIITNVL